VVRRRPGGRRAGDDGGDPRPPVRQDSDVPTGVGGSVRWMFREYRRDGATMFCKLRRASSGWIESSATLESKPDRVEIEDPLGQFSRGLRWPRHRRREADAPMRDRRHTTGGALGRRSAIRRRLGGTPVGTRPATPVTTRRICRKWHKISRFCSCAPTCFRITFAKWMTSPRWSERAFRTRLPAFLSRGRPVRRSSAVGGRARRRPRRKQGPRAGRELRDPRPWLSTARPARSRLLRCSAG